MSNERRGPDCLDELLVELAGRDLRALPVQALLPWRRRSPRHDDKST